MTNKPAPKKFIRFTFMCDPQTRKALDELGRRLDRKPSDAVRVAIHKMLAELKTETS